MAESLVGPWAIDKLDHLRKYLQAYTRILRKYNFQGYYYIDAFAGPGVHTLRPSVSRSVAAQLNFAEVSEFSQSQADQEQFLAGSPRVALELEHPFSRYIFIEKNAQRAAELEKLKSEYPDRKIVIHNTDCTQYLREKVANNPQIDWKRNRAVVFLDPFGMQVEWETIAALAKLQAVEIFLNFPVGMAINRLLPTNPQQLTEDRHAKLNVYFGSTEWFPTLYKRQSSLFEDESIEKVEESGKALMKWYQSRLKEAFGHVSRAALLRNSKGAHLYYLMLASPNATGVKIADHILSAGETV